MNVGGGTYLVETTTKYIVAESDTLLNGKHYVQVIDAANKKVNVVSYNLFFDSSCYFCSYAYNIGHNKRRLILIY